MERLGGQFCHLENATVTISEKDKNDLNMGLLPRTLFNLGWPQEKKSKKNVKKKKNKSQVPTTLDPEM